jgi:hypothetical protein
VALFGRRDADRDRHGAGMESDDEAVLTSGGADSEWFRPRFDGTYAGGPDGFEFLRFHPNGRVYLAPRAADAADAREKLGPGNPDPIVGQFTGAGRFVVQQRFERPIVFTALEADDDGIAVRITVTQAAQTGHFRYRFVPDAAPPSTSGDEPQPD